MVQLMKEINEAKKMEMKAVPHYEEEEEEEEDTKPQQIE